MKVISASTIAQLLEAHYEHDEKKFRSYAEFIRDAYMEAGNERAARIIDCRLDGSYKKLPKVTLN